MSKEISTLGVKKILSFILLLSLSFGLAPSLANAADCNPSWNGDWVMVGDCDFPDGYKVNGDLDLGSHILSVRNGTTMGFDLSTNKITFTTGKIVFLGSSSKMDNTVPTSARYYETVAYTAGINNKTTSCPAGMYAFYHLNPTIPTTPGTHYIIDQTSETSLNTSKTPTEMNDGVSQNATMYCGTR